MGGWQRQLQGRVIKYILLQESHVASRAEAVALEKLWASMWGLKVDETNPLSFWSVTTERAAGVGMLFHPDCKGQRLRATEEARGRVMVVDTPGMTLVNVYAPNDKGQREKVFHEISEQLKTPSDTKLLVAGDFNCVLEPGVDRVTNGKWSTGKNESLELSYLVAHHGLVDANSAGYNRSMTPRDDDERLGQITFWQGTHGARLDRCYLNHTWQHWTVDTNVVTPHVATDHQGWVTWLRDPQIQQQTRPLPPLAFPLKGRFPEALAEEVKAAVSSSVDNAWRRRLDWDTTVTHIKKALGQIQRQEKVLAIRSLKRWEKRLRKHIGSIQDVIAYEHSRVERRLRLRRATRLQAQTPTTPWIFQRLGSHGTTLIRDLVPLRSAPVPGDSLADTMAREWSSLLAQSHATAIATEKQAILAQLYTVPPVHQLQQADGQRLLQPVTQQEVHDAIKDLGAHKAAGGGRLNNDFYHELHEELAPRLVEECNAILHGAEMPQSFGEAIVVPLPKNGNSTDAMDYRPIALLQTSYKIFTKLLAARVQSEFGDCH